MRRYWKIWLPLGSLAVLGLAGWFFWRQTDIAAYSAKLEAVLKQAKDDGMTLTPEEIRQRLAVPDRDNAAPIYKNALGRFKGMHPQEAKELSTLKMTRFSSEAEFRRLGELLAVAKPELDTIEMASRKPGVDFRRPWEQGPAVLFPEFAEIKAACKALAFRAMLKSHQGKPVEALDDLDTIRRVAIHTGKEPILIGTLVQLSLYTILIDRLQHVVNEHPTPAVIAKAEKVLSDMPLPDMKAVAGSELVMCRVSYRMVARDPKFASSMGMFGDGQMDDATKRFALARFAPFNRAFEARTVELYDELYRELPNDTSDVLAVEKAFKAMDSKMLGGTDIATKAASVLFPVYGQSGEAMVSFVANKESAKAALRLLASHKQGTAFPEKLPFATTDLFTGKPLIYRKTKTGFTIYSVGRDKNDDNGVLSGEGENAKGFDVGWRYPEGRQPKSMLP